MKLRSTVGLRGALSLLVQTNRCGRRRSSIRPRRADISDLFLEELRERRVRLARLLRLLEGEVRRAGGAALPSGHRLKSSVPSTRPRRVA